jgi:hypothetical protein
MIPPKGGSHRELFGTQDAWGGIPDERHAVEPS